jgi:hypothetical protein
LAGSLKRELIAKYSIQPKMKFAYHELEIFVDGRSVFSYSRAEQIPTVENMMAAIENSQTAVTRRNDLAHQP